MKKIHVAFLVVLAALLSLGQLQRISLGPLTAVYAHDLVLATWILFLTIVNFKQVLSLVWLLIKSFFGHWLVVCLALLILIGWTAAIVTDTFPLWTLLYSLRLLLYVAFGWLLFKLKPISPNWLQLSFISSGLLIALFGWFQYLFIPDVRFLSIVGWDDHYYRLVSSQLDPNFTGLILTITLFWLWSLPFTFWEWLIHGLSKEQLQKVQKMVTVVASGMLLVAITLTFSRSSLVALVTGLIVYSFYFTKKNKLEKQINIKFKLAGLAIISILITTFMVAPKPSGEGVNLLRTASAYARVSNATNWLNSLQPYQVVIGRGLFVPPDRELETQPAVAADHANLPDNLIILLISGVGLVGTSLLILISIGFAQQLNLRASTLAIISGVSIHTMFNNSLLQPFILLMLIAVLVENSLSNQLVEKVKKVAEKAKA